MKKLVQEAHRRSLWQVLGIYLMGSWVVLQVVDQLHETAGLPDWVPSMALVLLLIGLPMVLATAFVQEGMSRKEPIGESESAEAPAEAAPAVATEPGLPKAPSETPGWIRGRVLTWRNAVAGGVAALALFGAATAVWMVMRSAGIGEAGTLVARGLITDGERVVLADFSGDSALAQAATMSLRVQLAESGVVSVAEPSFVRSVLERMSVEDGPVVGREGRGAGRGGGARHGRNANPGGARGAAGTARGARAGGRARRPDAPAARADQSADRA